MILEILDYCLIKSQLLEFSEEEIMAQFTDQDSQELWYSVLYNLTVDDDFLISDSSVFDKAREIIGRTRFNYDNKKIKGMANDLIDYFNTYASLPKEDVIPLVAEWGNKEATLHGLPSGVYRSCDLLEYVKYDHYYISYLFDNEETQVRINPTHAIASISYLINKFPDVFKNPVGNVQVSDQDKELLQNINREEAYHRALLIATFCSQLKSKARGKTRRQAKALLDRLLEMDPNENENSFTENYQMVIKKNKEQ